MKFTLDTSHLERSPSNDDAEANMPSILVTLDTSHFERSPLNDDAWKNMTLMVVTLDTSHLEMSPLNLVASGTFQPNNKFISVTAETSQDPIDPRGPMRQLGDSSRHSTMAECR